MAFQSRLWAGAALGLVGCSTLSFDGRWVGVCDTPDVDLRVDLYVYGNDDDEEAEPWATAYVYRPDRRGSSLVLDCRTVEHEEGVGRVTGCAGDWEGTGAAHDFDVSGPLEEGEPVPVLDGDCTIDGLTGDAELWRMP